jgi:hypothetical protein
MAWFGVGSGSRRAKPQRAQRFVQADRVVMLPTCMRRPFKKQIPRDVTRCVATV